MGKTTTFGDARRATEKGPAISQVESACEVPAAWKRSLAKKLLRWFKAHQRDLPWRRSADPYAVWISEIMLQQTQVSTVIPYFNRFLAAFPTVAHLAAADEHAVLRLWEGLGYYRRARQMHRAAQVIVAEHGGKFPRSLAEVNSLPGVGRYTAGAIVSIAYDQPAPILEANTVRVFSRLAAYSGETASSAGQKFLWNLAEAVVPAKDCGAFNQSLMELGSLVCTPRNPNCEACPVSQECAAFQSGRQQQIPHVRVKPPSEAVHEAAVVVYHRGQLLVRRRAASERWAGMWDFLRFPLEFPLEASTDHARLKNRALEIAGKVRDQSGIAIGEPRSLTTLKHGVTRFRITLDCYAATARSKKTTLPASEWQWIDPAELRHLALSMTGRKLADLLLSSPAL